MGWNPGLLLAGDSLLSEPPGHTGRMVKNSQELGFRKSEWVPQGRVWEPG